MMTIDNFSKHPIQKIQIKDLDYYYIEKGQGETIFFLHGFPDLANTWDESIEVLSKEYRCIAPALRGYFPSSIPKDGDYSPKTIAEDIGMIAEKLGIERYYVIGHDWGASVAYSVFNLYPEKVIKGITVAIPHPRAIKFSLLLLFKARHFLKLGNPKNSVAYTRKNNFRYLDTLYKRWAPNWSAYTSTAKQVKETFAMEGRLEAALAYYWSFAQNRTNKELNRFLGKLPSMPLLTFAGKTDGAIMLKQFHAMKPLMKAPFELVVHEQAGHFLHQEDTSFFVEHVSRFLKDQN